MHQIFLILKKENVDLSLNLDFIDSLCGVVFPLKKFLQVTQMFWQNLPQ